MFAWLHHLVDERYFNSIEVFFLFAGHTHSPIDQMFSVIGKAIRRSAFIGSTIAMQELFKIAHDITQEKSKAGRITDVISLDIYHDYVSKYDPVINNLIRNYGGPHRFIIEMNPLWGFSDLRYQWQSPQNGWNITWLPERPAPNADTLQMGTNISLSEDIFFGGTTEMLAALDVNSTKETGTSMTSATSQSKALAEAKRNLEVTERLPKIRELEKNSFAEQSKIYEREADHGKAASLAAHRVPIRPEMISNIAQAMLKNNSNSAGHICFIKRSLCNDPQWLDKRPNILPNPKLWREQTKATKETLTEEEENIEKESADTSAPTKKG